MSGQCVKSSPLLAQAMHIDLTYYTLTRYCYYGGGIFQTVKSCISELSKITMSKEYIINNMIVTITHTICKFVEHIDTGLFSMYDPCLFVH